MIPFAIAGIQMRISGTSSNVEAMEAKLKEVMKTYPWVQMVLYSELAPQGVSLKRAEPLPGPTENIFCKLAAKYKVWLLPGSMYERDGDRIYNTASVIDPEGCVIGRYRKQFPFHPYEDGVSDGNHFLVFDVPQVGRFGVSICYDMWFPETSRTMAAMGAEVILHPSLTATIDRDIELSIARATAAVNQCYMIDINGVGDGGYGRSIVCAPDGRVLYEADRDEEIIPVEIDLDRVRRARRYGVLRLGQALKSFRDRTVDFPVYDRQQPLPYLNALGKLEKPTRMAMAGQDPMPFPEDCDRKVAIKGAGAKVAKENGR